MLLQLKSKVTTYPKTWQPVYYILQLHAINYREELLLKTKDDY